MDNSKESLRMHCEWKDKLEGVCGTVDCCLCTRDCPGYDNCIACVTCMRIVASVFRLL